MRPAPAPSSPVTGWRAMAVALLGIVVLGPGCARLRAAAPKATATPATANTVAGNPAGAATVVRVVDGDTLKVSIAGRNDRVRLIGIDTPESVKPNTPVQCYALEASARTKSLLPVGEAVTLVRDVDVRDRYGRLLAYVYRRRDGLFVNLALVKDGYAAPYTFPPNVAHVDEFVAAGRQAREANRGLWGACGGPHEPQR